MTYYFLAASFEGSLSEPFNIFTFFLLFRLYTELIKVNQVAFMALCENSKDFSSDFSMIKNIVALYSSSLSIALVWYFKLGFFNSICLLRFITINF